MKFKREIIVIMLVICILFMISAVSANYDANEVVSVTNESVKTSDVSSDDSLGTENDGEILSDGEVGTFTNLKNNITATTSGSTLELKNDFELSTTTDSAIISNIGIDISKTLTIDGKGHYIDAKEKTNVFNLFSKVTLKNIIFKNGKSNYGGFIYYYTSYKCEIINCTFINGYSTSAGGAVYSYGTSVDVTNSTFINNYANGNGGALYINAYNFGNIENCTFINNFATGEGSAIYGYSDGTISNSIFINNNGNTVINSNSGTTASYNWFGNTIEDYETNVPIVGSGVTLSNYYVLDMSLDNDNSEATISLNNLYESGVLTSNDQNYALPSFKFDVKATGTNAHVDEFVLGSSGVTTFTYDSAGAYSITISNSTVELTREVKPTFILLNNQINTDGVSEITLNQDYEWDSSKDSSLTNGIEFAKDMTIEGNGHIIDAKGLSNIFYFNDISDSYNLILKNMVFKNAVGENGAVIYFKGNKIELINCTLLNNSANQGDAIHIIANSNENKITQSLFINNTCSNSVIYIDSDNACIIDNSILVNNDATNNIVGSSNVIADNNWWGNTQENNIVDISNVNGITANKWLFLMIDASADLTSTATLSLNNIYDGTSIGKYAEYALPKISINVAGNGFITSKNSVALDNGEGTFDFMMADTDATLTASYENINTNKELEYVIVEDGSFKHLNDLIYFTPQNGILNLNRDFAFVEGADDAYADGISVLKGLTINGNNYIIDAKKKSAIFWLQGGNVYINNLTFINAIGDGVLYNQANSLTVKYCDFINNVGSNSGSVIYDNSKSTFVNCTFLFNSATNGGVLYSYQGSSTFINSTFGNNSASKGGVFYMYDGNINCENCTFGNNSATTAGVIYSYYGEVKCKNTTFENNSATNAGVFYNYYAKLSLEDCDVKNNTADQGAVLYDSGYLSSFVNSRIIKNKAKSGSIIYGRSNIATADKCIFINNTATASVIYSTSSYELKNSIILSNSVNSIIYGTYTQQITVNNNWFGNTFDNYSDSPMSGDIIKNWLFLNIRFHEDYATVCLDQYTKSFGSVSTYTDNNLPTFTLNINSTSLDLSEINNVTLKSNGASDVSYSLINTPGALTACYESVSLTKEVTFGDFDILQELINDETADLIELNRDYIYNLEDTITTGILINRNITIDGKGHTIDAKGMSRIFNLHASGITFKNIVFANGYTTYGPAIFYNYDNTDKIDFEILNCTFVNNTATASSSSYGGGAIFIKTNDGSFDIKDSKFINNSAHISSSISSMGGAIYLNTKNAEVNIYNSSFINNKGKNGGALYVASDNSHITIDKSLFKENHATGSTGASYGNAILWKTTNDNGGNVVKNSIFIHNTNSNYYAFALSSGSVDIDDNWWGSTVNNYKSTSWFYTGNINPNSILFLNGSTTPPAIYINETSTVKFFLQSYDKTSTDVNDYDNGLLYEDVRLDISSVLGYVNKHIASLNEEITYNATDIGEGVVSTPFNGIPLEIKLINKQHSIISISLENYTTMYLSQYFYSSELKNMFTLSHSGTLKYLSNDTSIISFGSPYGLNVHTVEGSVKITIYYEGTKYYDPASVDLIVNVVPIPLIINITNYESDNFSLNVSDSIILNVELVRNISDNVHTTTPSYYHLSTNTLNNTNKYSSGSIILISKTGSGDKGNITVKGITGGTAKLVLGHTNNVFDAKNVTLTITVNRIPTEITIDDINPLKVDDESQINANFFINGTQSTTNLIYESSDENVIRFTLGSNFKAVGNGTVTLTVKYEGNATHENSSKTITVTVTKYDSEISLSSDNLTPEYLQTITITPTVTSGATGTITYYIGDTAISGALGLTDEFKFTVDRAGEFNITAKYSGDYKYSESSKNITINSVKADNIINVNVTKDKSYPDEVTVNLTSLVPGDYTIDVNGTLLTITVPEGKTSAILTHRFGAGQYYANITSAPTSDVYNQITQNDTFSVARAINNAQIIIDAQNYLPGAVTVNVTGVKGIYVVRFSNSQTVDVSVGDDGKGSNTIYLIAGDYTATLSLDNSNYTTVADEKQFSVVKSQNNVEVIVDDDNYLPGAVTVTVRANAAGTYTVELNDTQKTKLNIEVTSPNIEASTTLYLKAGRYQANASFADHDNYTLSITNKTFNVIKSDNTVIINITNETYPNAVKINVTATVDDTYNVKVGDIIIPVRANTTVTYKFGASESYTATIEPWSHENYTAVITDAQFKVNKGTNNVRVIIEDTYLPGAVTVKVTADADGIYRVVINDTEVLIDVKNGEGINTTVLAAGNYSANATFSDHENYTVSITNTTFNVLRSDISLAIFVNDAVYGENVTGYITTNVSGTYTVKIGDGDEFTIDLVSGRNDFTRKVLLDVAENYPASVSIAQRPEYNAKSASYTFKVVQKATDFNATSSKDSYTYGEEIILKIELPDDATGNVTFRYANGEVAGIINDVTLTRQLSLGILDADSYSISAEYGGDLNYIAITKSLSQFDVAKADNIIEVSVIASSYPDEVLVKVNATVAGTYKVDINATVLDVEANATGVYYRFDAGSYYANTSYTHKNYNAIIKNTTFTVDKGINNIKVIVESVTYPNGVNIKVIADVDGTYTVDINGSLKEIVANGEGISLNLAGGDYYTNITGYTSDNYIGVTHNSTFKVNKAIAVAVVSVDDTVLPGDTQIKVISNIPGTYTVKISNGESVDVIVADGEGSAGINLPFGSYNATTSFMDYENYTVILSNATFEVKKADNHIQVIADSVTYPDEVNIRVTADIDGIYTLDVNGTLMDIVANGEGISLALKAGDYYADIVGYTSPYYNAVTANATFTVKKKINNIEVIVEDATLPGSVTVNVNADVDGVYAVDINGTLVNVEVTSGSGVNFTHLKAGKNYLATVIFEHENYTANIIPSKFHVDKSNNHIDVVAESVTYPGAVTVKVYAEIDGIYTVDVNGTLCQITANDNVGIRLNLKAGNYYANITGYDDPDYTGIINNAVFDVLRMKNNIVVAVSDTVLPGLVSIEITADVDGVYAVDINGTLVDVEVVSGRGVNSAALKAGENYFATTSFDEGENYTANITGSTFDVTKSQNSIKVIVSDTVLPCEVSVMVDADVDGVYAVDINGTLVDVEVKSGSGMNTTKLVAGKNYFATTTFADIENYTVSITNSTFDVLKGDNHIKVIVNGVKYPDMVNIRVEADIDGTYTVDVSGNLYDVEANGEGIDLLLDADSYYANITAYTSDIYNGITTNATFRVDKGTNTVSVIADNYIFEGKALIKLTATVDGLYTVKIGDVNLTVNVTGGAGENTTVLGEGTYTTQTLYQNTNYDNIVSEKTFKVLPHEISDCLTIRDSTLHENSTITLTDEGKVVIVIEYFLVEPNDEITVKTMKLNVNGVSKTTIDAIESEKYVKIEYVADETSQLNFTLTYEGTHWNGTEYSFKSNMLTYNVIVKNSTVSMTIPQINYPENATVYVKAGNDGLYTLTVDGKNYTVNVSNGEGSAVIDILNAGMHTASIVYDDDVLIRNETTFNVLKASDIELNITVDDGVMTITDAYSDNGNVTVTVNGRQFNATLINGSAAVIVDLYPGEYDATLTYKGDANYENITKTVKLSVPKFTPSLENAMNITTPEGTTSPVINITLPTDATGNITLILDGNKSYNATLANGSAVISLGELSVGSHNITVTYTGDGNYTNAGLNKTFTVEKAEIPQNSTSIGIDIPKGTTTPTVTITLPEDASGNITVTVDGNKTYNATLVNGSATIAIDELSVGEHTLSVGYSGDDKYDTLNKTASFEVPKAELKKSDIKVSTDLAVGSKSPKVTVTLPSDAGGYAVVTVDGVALYVSIKNGKGSVNLNSLSYGKHKINVKYYGDAKYSEVSKNAKVNIPKPVLKSQNKSIGYSGVLKYKVSLTVSGKAASGKYVTLKYKGKTLKAKTNKKGYATFKINTKKLKVGKYKLTISFSDISLTKTLKVKNVIKAKNLKAKNSTQKVIKIKLKKVNGKYLKAKKVKLKFKGKTYKAKTNKKGVAKFTIKKNVIKKLKVGKTYKYKVIYGKNTMTKKIKIRR